MYNVPEHLIQLDDSTLCIASRSEKCRKTELLKLLLPPKLTLPAEDEGRSKGNHFEMLTGLYIEHSIHQIRALSYEDTVITSQNGRKGVQMYKMDSESGGKTLICCSLSKHLVVIQKVLNLKSLG